MNIRKILGLVAASLVLAAPALAETMTLRDSAAVATTEYELNQFVELIMDHDYEAMNSLLEGGTACFNQATRDVFVYQDVIDSQNVRVRVPGNKTSVYTRRYNVLSVTE